MNQLIAQTNSRLLLIYLLGVMLATYLLVHYPTPLSFNSQTSDLRLYFVTGLVLIALITLVALARAKYALIEGDEVVIRYTFWPVANVRIPLSSLMLVAPKQFSFPGTTSLKLRASRSGDENQTVQDTLELMTTLSADLTASKKSAHWYTNTEQNQRKQLRRAVQRLRELYVTVSIGNAHSEHINHAQSILQPYIDRNLQQVQHTSSHDA